MKNRKFAITIDADETYAAGVSKLELVEGEAPSEICKCGHAPDIHTPCCVSACGCDGFEPRKPSVLEAKLNTEMAEHTREVLRHAVTKHRAEKAEKLAKGIRRIHGEAMVRVCGRAEKAEAEAVRLRGILEKIVPIITDTDDRFDPNYSNAMRELADEITEALAPESTAPTEGESE